MNCVRAEKEVLLNNSTDKQVAHHLSECAECRGIAKALENFISAKPNAEKYNVPKSIDASLTSEAQAFIDERQSGETAAANPMVRPFHTWATIFAYVACFILAAWMLIIVLSSGKQTGKEENAKMVTSSQLSPEIKDWDKLDMSDDFFILNTEIEIDFAALSFAEDREGDVDNSEDQEEYPLGFLDSMI